MTAPIRRVVLVLAALLSLVPPAIGAFLRWGGWPPGFGVFPPQTPMDSHGVPMPKPGFSPVYFTLASILAGVMLAYLLFPTWFGFAPVSAAPGRPARSGRAPWWSWVGALVNVICWGMMWFSTAPVVKYLFTPLWWGFILVIDGVVYVRTGGASILAKLPKHMLALIAMSVTGWWLFEWLNYFVLENWVYPISPSIFTEPQAYFWFSLTYTCVWPAIFEWYTLLRTFPKLNQRWARGPALSVGKTGLLTALLVGAAAGVMVGIFPYLLFFTIWLGSLFVLPAAMGLLGYWTPFSPIERGNWTPMTLIAVAGLANRFFWEFWNYGSNAFIPGRNPNYWVYEIPFVNVIHIFSEMPLLGYFGYLPFGIQCWVWLLLASHLVDLHPDLDPENVGLPGA